MTHETRKYRDKNLTNWFNGTESSCPHSLHDEAKSLSDTYTQQLQHLVPSTVSFLHLFKNINVLAVDFLVSKDKQVAVGPSW